MAAKAFRWHIPVFLAPAVLVYTADQNAKSLGADAMRLDATLRKLSLIG